MIFVNFETRHGFLFFFEVLFDISNAMFGNAVWSEQCIRFSGSGITMCPKKPFFKRSNLYSPRKSPQQLYRWRLQRSFTNRPWPRRGLCRRRWVIPGDSFPENVIIWTFTIKDFTYAFILCQVLQSTQCFLIRLQWTISNGLSGRSYLEDCFHHDHLEIQ